MKVIVADDHKIVLDGIRYILQSEPHIELVGEAFSGDELLALLKQTEADVILFDLNMPDKDGFEAASLIRNKHPEIKLIALTMLDDRESIARTLEIGVNGYLLKNTGKDEMILALNTVMSGEAYYSKQVAQTMMQSYAKSNKMESAPQLTPRELEVLQLIAKEYTTQQIADQLYIAVNTVETHRKNLHSKLGVKSVVGLLKYALEHRLIKA